MSKNQKIILGVIAVIIIIIIGVVVSNNKNKEQQQEKQPVVENQVEEEFVQTLTDGTRLNTSTKMQETKTIDGMEITGIQLTERGNVSQLLGTITNKSSETKGGYPVDITILDKTGKEIVTVGGYIGKLEPGESTQLSSSATFDYANAYDYRIEKVGNGD